MHLLTLCCIFLPLTYFEVTITSDVDVVANSMACSKSIIVKVSDRYVAISSDFDASSILFSINLVADVSTTL